jgi:beta-lactamase regulating signal transducer with metallopeptidase domain
MIAERMIAEMTTAQPMTILTNWLSTNTMHSLGWALVHFLWQGTALAALAAAAMALCRRAPVRYLVGVGALVLMLLAPVATFLFYSQTGPGEADAVKSSPLAAVARPKANWVIDQHPRVNETAAASGAAPSLSSSPALDALPWLVNAWLVGVAFLSLRTMGGFFLLERERRRYSVKAQPRIVAICRTLQDRLGLHRAIQYCECKWLQTPAVIGWFRPVVFLPVTALTGLSEEQLGSVIAHELAHIRRFDPFVNVFQIWVETLLFYHPAVWWLNKRIRTEREHCCDEVAVSLCGNAVEYARALTLMEEWRSAPVLAMAANRGPLTERILRVLGLKTFGAGVRGIGVSGSMLCLTAALIAGNALFAMSRPVPQIAFLGHAAEAHAAGEQAVEAHGASTSAPSSAPSPAPNATPMTAPTIAPIPKPSPAYPQNTENQNNENKEQPAGSYIDAMKAAGLGDLSVDQLVEMKIQNVTPEYVRGLREQGLNPDARKIIEMKIQGITPEYVRNLHASGLNPNEHQLLALKIQGADAEYYRGLKEAGIEPDIDRLIGLKIQGVTPEYVREIHAAGLAADANQIIGLKIQNVTPTYLKELHEQGIDPKAHEAIELRIQGVTPEYVRDIRALGLQPNVHELVSMRIQNVSPEYIKALQKTGLKLDVHGIIEAKIQDVTPEFVDQAMKHGFKDLTLHKLVQLRQMGILDSKADL